MPQNSGWGLFRKRNVLGAVLVAGIAAGIYLADFWKGLGGGSMLGIGVGNNANSTATTNSKSSDSATEVEDIGSIPAEIPLVVKVVIDNRSYILRSAEGDSPVALAKIVELAKAAKGDDDGIRVRIYRKLSSRATAEEDLREALAAAGLQDKEFVFMPTPVGD